MCEQIAVLVDCTEDTGFGHLFRCLEFVCSFPDFDMVSFFIKDLNVDVKNLIESKIINVKVHDYSFDVDLGNFGNFDLLIVDSYCVNESWETRQRQYCKRIFVIDDLMDRVHNCDVLLNQGMIKTSDAYKNLVSKECKIFIGPRYTLIGKKYFQEKKFKKDVKNLVIYLGAGDKYNQTEKALLASLKLDLDKINVLIGTNNSSEPKFLRYEREFPEVKILRFTDKLEQVYLEADIGIGVCGVSQYERMASSVPTLVCVTACNQILDTDELNKLGVVKSLGCYKNISSKDWHESLTALINDNSKRSSMVLKSRSLMGNCVDNRQKLVKAALHG